MEETRAARLARVFAGDSPPVFRVADTGSREATVFCLFMWTKVDKKGPNSSGKRAAQTAPEDRRGPARRPVCPHAWLRDVKFGIAICTTAGDVRDGARAVQCGEQIVFYPPFTGPGSLQRACVRQGLQLRRREFEFDSGGHRVHLLHVRRAGDGCGDVGLREQPRQRDRRLFRTCLVGDAL